MNAYTLPTSIEISGIEYGIETDYRVILDILTAMSDVDMEEWEKQEVMYRIFYPNYETIPKSDYYEACKKASEFIDGNIPEGRPKPKTMDWEQDAALIIPAVNKVAGVEVRAIPYLHWWTFLGYYMEIGDGLFSQVISIRQKKAKGKSLEKWEKEFVQSAPELVNLKSKYSEEQKKEMAELEKWL